MEDPHPMWFKWCSSCEEPIRPGEPYAALTCSQRCYDSDDTHIRVLAAFLMASLCRTCRDQCQLTSPDVAVGAKLTAITRLVPRLEESVWTLPPLPYFPAADPWRLSDCQFCERSQPPAESWIEIAVSYECHAPDASGTDYEVDVLAESTFVVMCRACCVRMPFPMLQKDDDYDSADRWCAAFAHLLAEPGH